jgi:hypothetical protein
METTMMTFFVMILTITLMIVGGVYVNMYLYTQGAFGPHRSRRLSTVQLRQEAIAEDQYYMSIGATDKQMGDYAKRSIIGFVSVLFLVVMIGVLYLNSIQH